MLTEFQFDDLPLQHEGKCTGLYAEGVADIEYATDGTFQVGRVRIKLTEFQRGVPVREMLVPAAPWVGKTIALTLHGDPVWLKQVRDKVAEELRNVDNIEAHPRFQSGWSQSVEV